MNNRVYIAASDKHLAVSGSRWLFVSYDFGQGFNVARLFVNVKSRDYFMRRVTQPPACVGAVRFK